MSTLYNITNACRRCNVPKTLGLRPAFHSDRTEMPKTKNKKRKKITKEGKENKRNGPNRSEPHNTCLNLPQNAER
jgi:hypothetical protein